MHEIETPTQRNRRKKLENEQELDRIARHRILDFLDTLHPTLFFHLSGTRHSNIRVFIFLSNSHGQNLYDVTTDVARVLGRTTRLIGGNPHLRLSGNNYNKTQFLIDELWGIGIGTDYRRLIQARILP